MKNIELMLEEKWEIEKAAVLNKTWVAFGENAFDPEKFRPIMTDDGTCYLNKPYGGLWASPTDTEWGWFEWCIAERFRTERLRNCFEFKLADNAKIYVINFKIDLETISTKGPNELGQFSINYDFLLEKGYDGLYVTEEAAREFHYPNGDGIVSLYSWDCESICVFNKDVVKPIN